MLLEIGHLAGQNRVGDRVGFVEAIVGEFEDQGVDLFGGGFDLCRF
jgi:hypothetical protein